MYVPFDQLPDTARIWIYQAARELTEAEAGLAEAHLREFCTRWVAHGHPLRVSFAVLERRFVVLTVDEAAGSPSGCSIDSSVQALRELGERLGVDFLDKSRIAFRQPDGTTGTVGRADLRGAVTDGVLQPHTPVYDTLAPSIGALRTAWVRPAAETWLARYFFLGNNAR